MQGAQHTCLGAWTSVSPIRFTDCINSWCVLDMSDTAAVCWQLLYLYHKRLPALQSIVSGNIWVNVHTCCSYLDDLARPDS